MTSDISRTSIMDYLATNWPEVDLALILARTIDSIKTDPSQLRNTVYELARTKLLREASERGQPIGRSPWWRTPQGGTGRLCV